MRSGKENGVVLLALLGAVAALGLGAAALGETWGRVAQREREAELLWIGGQFRQAIGLYYQRGGGGTRRFPQRLEDLLEDARSLAPQRYLRRLYRDPMTGKAEWGLVRAPDGGIMGVHSLAERQTLRRTNLGVENRKLEGKARLSEWQFVYEPPEAQSGIQGQAAKPRAGSGR